MILKRTTAADPTSSWLPLSEAKAYLRVDSGDEDARITALIKAAHENVQSSLNYSILEETYQLFRDRFPYHPTSLDNQLGEGVHDIAITEALNGAAAEIKVPWGPIIEVSEFVTIDTSGVENVFDSDKYNVDAEGRHGRVSLAFGQTWPDTTLKTSNGIRITFTSGHSVSIKEAVLETLAAYYERRGDEKGSIPATARAMIEPYRWRNI